MIGQAWERHRRDQLLISCSPRRVAEVMNAEHHKLYRKGMHETFVMEIPLLCSDVLGYRPGGTRPGPPWVQMPVGTLWCQHRDKQR